MVTTTFPRQDESLPVPDLSREQLIDHARRLAARQRLTTENWWDSLKLGPPYVYGRNNLLPQLEHNAQLLREARRLLTRAAEGGSGISPAGTWLLDNYGLICDQVQAARRQLPHTCGNRLPRLSDGAGRGLPRVYDLARELIADLDGQLDWDRLEQFFSAYQSVTVLTLGELWATANMLRLALIENLGRAALQIIGRGDGRADASVPDEQHNAADERAMRNGVESLRALAVARLEGIRRGPKRGRTGPAARPGGHLRTHGLCQPRLLPPHGGATRPAQSLDGGGSGTRRRGTGPQCLPDLRRGKRPSRSA